MDSFSGLDTGAVLLLTEGDNGVVGVLMSSRQTWTQERSVFAWLKVYFVHLLGNI